MRKKNCLLSFLSSNSIFVFLFLSSSLFSQNLVANPSFEDTIKCPDAMTDVTYSTGWSSYANTPDYFNTCSSNSNYSIPNNGWGNQNPYSTGCNAYVGFWTYYAPFSPNGREFIGRQLSAPLIIGQKYYVSFKISLGETSNCGIDKIGCFFLTYSPSGILSVNNSPHVYSNIIVTDKLNWIAVVDTFTADSTYQYIAIGNFFDDNNTDTIKLGPPNAFGYTAYYYLDDICISSDSTTCSPFSFVCNVGINENNIENVISIYPNPFSDFTTIEITKEKFLSYDFIIYDLTGRRVKSIAIKEKITKIERDNLTSGVYLFTFVSSDKSILNSGKIIIN